MCKLICVAESRTWTRTKSEGAWWRFRKWLIGEGRPSSGPGMYEVVTLRAWTTTGTLLLSEYQGMGGYAPHHFILATKRMLDAIECMKAANPVCATPEDLKASLDERLN